MNHPLLYEINTRCWLRDLGERHRATLGLDGVPESEFEGWQRLGFTHIWLMGVWNSDAPLGEPETARPQAARLSGPSPILAEHREDVANSPYAISEYVVPAWMGGVEALKSFRTKLHRYGLNLLLDFVPNHLGLLHPWVNERPNLFVQASSEVPGTFQSDTKSGFTWLAHGKDPYFPAWIDTAQLDYRRTETRTAMIQVLEHIAALCDGVRCDMAMLVLKDVFTRTWSGFSAPTELPSAEFWTDAISIIKSAWPDFLFLAEAYWGLESKLQSVGFDYTYDKALYDHIVERNYPAVSRHLLEAEPGYVAASAHFLENHDESRIASLLNLQEHRAAALLVLGLPGMRLLHQGQLTGARMKIPVQLIRCPEEPLVTEVQELYETLLPTLRSTAVSVGRWELLVPRPAWSGNATAESFVVVQWQSGPKEFDLVVTNLVPNRGQCYVSLRVDALANSDWRMKDLLGEEDFMRRGRDLADHGLYLDLPEHGAQLFRFTMVH